MCFFFYEPMHYYLLCIRMFLYLIADQFQVIKINIKNHGYSKCLIDLLKYIISRNTKLYSSIRRTILIN